MSYAHVISKTLPYADVAGKSMRVEGFTQFSSLHDGAVKAHSATEPHGLLEVRLDGFSVNPILPIFHTIDYKNACEMWDIFKQDKDDYIIWVIVVPVEGLRRFVAWAQPRLEFNLWSRSMGSIIEVRRGLFRGE